MSLQLVGVDLETGGLNGYETLQSGERVHGAAHYPILEMAFVVCDENLNKEFSFSVGIWDESFLERMDPWALEAHTKSGLIDQLRNQSGEHLGVFADIEDAELFAIETLLHFGVSIYDRKAKTGAVMFGNSIGFDVSYIDAQMPSLKNFFHYRTIDVSSIDLMRQTAWAGLGLPKAEKQYAHTAMSDIQETLGELMGYTLHLERPAANVLMSRDNPRIHSDCVVSLPSPDSMKRVETGAVQFGDDWPGVFIRGDNAAYYSITIDGLLSGEIDPIALGALSGLNELLKSSNARV